MSVFANIETTITGEITNLLQQTGNLISSISPIFAGLFAIYLMLWVFNYWANGGLVEMGVDLIRKLVAWSLVIGLCFNAGEYVKWAEIIYNFSTDLASALTGATYSTSAMDTNWGTTDNILTQLEKRGEDLEWYEIRTGVILAAWIAFYKFCLLIYMVMVFIYLMTAKLSLLCVLMVGPLFLACFLFPATRQWAMNWVNQVWNYTITILLFVCLGVIQDGFFVSLMLPALNGMNNGGVDAVAATVALAGNLALIFCGTILFTYFATKVPAIASALTGGSAQVTGVPMRDAARAAGKWASNTNVGGIVTAPFRATSALLRGFKNSVTPK